MRPSRSAPSIIARAIRSFECLQNRFHELMIYRSALLRVDRLAAGEHRHELLDPPRARLCSLGGLDPIQDRVAVLAVEGCEHRLRLRLSRKGVGQVGWDID